LKIPEKHRGPHAARVFETPALKHGVTAGLKLALQNIPNKVVYFNIHTKLSSA